MLGQRSVHFDQLLDLVLARRTDLIAVRDVRLGRRRYLLDAVRLLLAEAQAPPRLEQRRVVRRRDDGVSRPVLLDPAGGSEGVEVAHVLGLLDRVAGAFDEHVRAPGGVFARGADEVAGEAAFAEGDRAGGGFSAPPALDLPGGASDAPHALELRERLGGLLEARREQRLDAPLACVARRQKVGRVAKMVVAERRDLDASHAT